MTVVPATQDAIIFSGGASNAAYEVGVVKALLTENCGGVDASPIVPSIYTGVSTGALNAAVMTAHADWAPEAAVEILEKLWLERIAGTSRGFGNGLFRFRFNPMHYRDLPEAFMRPWRPLLDFVADSLYVTGNTLRRTAQVIGSEGARWSRVFKLADFSASVDLGPLHRLVRDAVDIDKLHHSTKKIRITAANWDKGEPENFDNAMLEGEMGYQAIAAAAAIPGIVPSQLVDDREFVDSAVLIGTPLKPAIEAGDRSEGAPRLTLHAIYLDPESSDVPLSRVSDTLSTIYRLYTLAFARSVKADMTKADSINERLVLVGGSGNPSGTLDPRYKNLRRQLARELKGKVEVVIHRYSPARIEGELFQFNRELIEKMIARGFNDARRHDCKKAGCVLDLEAKLRRAQAESED